MAVDDGHILKTSIIFRPVVKRAGSRLISHGRIQFFFEWKQFFPINVHYLSSQKHSFLQLILDQMGTAQW